MTTDSDDVLAHAAAWRDAGKGVALAMVVTTWGVVAPPRWLAVGSR